MYVAKREPVNVFLNRWGDAVLTSLGFFWMAFWAFALGYVVSSMIQVFVTQARMKRAMGAAGAKSVGLAAIFGFLSSSCSFSALATTRSLLAKGAGFVPALAFLLASTNLVIELGIVIAVFLSWHFVVGEYLGGLLLIGTMWIVVKLTLTASLEREARSRIGEDEDADPPDWRSLIRSREGWASVGRQFGAEWRMVWKDVTFGFTVAGVIATFVPRPFFESLFVGSASHHASFLQVVAQTLIAPVAAFLTFIGSMGNIPLAGVLYASGAGFAGVMAFIFSDLVVFPVVRMNAKFYGWKTAMYLVAVLLVCLVSTSLILHYAFDAVGLLPSAPSHVQTRQQLDPGQRFALDYTAVLNVAFLVVSAILAWAALSRRSDSHGHHHDHHDEDRNWLERLLTVLAVTSYLWLAGGVVAYAMT